MAIHFYNTLTRRKERFEPQDPQRVTMYACGPTVYNYAHIGNARPAVIFDLVRQLLGQAYPNVVYARNITDVDDKINQAAADQGVPIDTISQRYTRAYHEDMAALGVAPPDLEPRATDHIAAIVDMIGRLLDQGHAYEAEGHVLFDVSTFDDYGALSHRDRGEMIAGARVEVAPYKRNPEDFVLWKPSTAEQPGWDSPWGRGRPGWHIECSAMSAAHLGEVIDIHAGGQDLIFPHHENEIAQSRCAHGAGVFARYWLHNGFVQVESRKMSKSLGNVLVVRDLLASHPGEVLRYLLLSAHYRQPLDWSEAALQQTSRTLDRLYAVWRDHGAAGVAPAEQPPAALLEALQDDLNTPRALAELSELARRLTAATAAAERRQATAELRAGAQLLGLLREAPEQWFHRGTVTVDAEWIESLIAEREQARGQRDFATADRIRDQLADMGVILEDGAEGTRWRVES